MVLPWILTIGIWTAGQPATDKPRELQIPFDTRAECMKAASKYRQELLRSNPFGMVNAACIDGEAFANLTKDALTASGAQFTARKGWARSKEQREATTPSLSQTIQRAKQ